MLTSRLSCCTYPLQDRAAEDAIAAIADAGFFKVDVLGKAPHFDLISLPSHRRLAEAASQNGVRVANLGTYEGASFASDSAAEQQQALDALELAIVTAHMLGSRSIRVKAGDDSAACLPHIVPWFQRGAAHAAARGIYLGFENHGGEISGSPELCAELCRAVGSPHFGVLFDPCNLASAGCDYRHALRTFGAHITHVHFKDGALSPSTQTFERGQLGEGTIDISWCIRELEALGYCGDYAVEFELGEGGEMASLATDPERGLSRWRGAFAEIVGAMDPPLRLARTPFNEEAFALLGVADAWIQYPELGFGTGQTLACLDDGCDLTVPEWQTTLPADDEGVRLPKVAASWNSIDDNADPTPVPPGYHGTSVGFPSSLLMTDGDGITHCGIAFGNQVAQVRCVSIVHLPTCEDDTIAAALEWVLANKEQHNITAVNLAPLDNKQHSSPLETAIDAPLRRLRDAGVWVSAPCGNNGHTAGISWPACASDCFAIGATIPNPGVRTAHLDRCHNTDLLVPAAATSSSNAFAAAAFLCVREAIELSGFDWQSHPDIQRTTPCCSNIADAVMTIFRWSGRDVIDEATKCRYRELDLLSALRYVLGAGGGLRWRPPPPVRLRADGAPARL